MGYFRDTNIVRLGDGNTILRVGTNTVATQEWTNARSLPATIGVSAIESPGDFKILPQMGNGTARVVARFQVANNVGTTMLDIGSNPGVSSTGTWWSIDCNHALRCLATTAQPNLSIDWNNLANTIGGGFQCEPTARFDSTVIFAGKNRLQNQGGPYRYVAWGGVGTSTGMHPYSVIVNGGMMLTSGDLHVYSDRRNKQDIQSFDEEKALSVLKGQRSVRFKYKGKEEQKMGFIANELVQHEYLRDAVSVMSPTGKEEDERYVLSSDQLVPVLWAALRSLAAEVDKLKNIYKL